MTIDFSQVTKLLIDGEEASKIKVDGVDAWDEPSTEPQWLKFTAEESNSTVILNYVAGTYQTSTDGSTWSDYTLGTKLTLENIGDYIYFKATTQNQTCWKNAYNPKFTMTGKIAASGNVMSLLDETCQRMDVPDYCFNSLFNSCSSLTQAPELPATTLAMEAYSEMFAYCSNLTQAPDLPASTLNRNCYYSMFGGCTNLQSIKIGYTGNFTTTYFQEWVTRVAATGTFYYNGGDTTRGKNAIPEGWTITPFDD